MGGLGGGRGPQGCGAKAEEGIKSQRKEDTGEETEVRRQTAKDEREPLTHKRKI